MAALFLTGAVDGVAYEEVSGATAEIAGHGFVDIGVGGVRFLSKQGGCGHDLSGLAVAALRNLFSDPGILDRMWTVCCKAFDGENSLCLPRLRWGSGRSGLQRRRFERCRLRTDRYRSRILCLSC